MTETDIALSLVEGLARGFQREMLDSVMIKTTVEVEWYGKWYEYEKFGDQILWTLTRRVE